MTFEQLWRQAEEADAASGGMDTVPEDEKIDYVGACLIANGFVWKGIVLGTEYDECRREK